MQCTGILFNPVPIMTHVDVLFELFWKTYTASCVVQDALSEFMRHFTQVNFMCVYVYVYVCYFTQVHFMCVYVYVCYFTQVHFMCVYVYVCYFTQVHFMCVYVRYMCAIVAMLIALLLLYVSLMSRPPMSKDTTDCVIN